MAKDFNIEQFDPDNDGIDGHIFALPHSQSQSKVWVIPVPFEATTSFGQGTAQAPKLILEASEQVDLFDLENGHPWRDGIFLLPTDPRIASWNLEVRALYEGLMARDGGTLEPKAKAHLDRANNLCHMLNGLVEEKVENAFAHKRIPALLGGDHSVSLGAHKAAIKRHPDLGILHIDAHADLRPAYQGFTYSHASVLYNTLQEGGLQRLVQVGIRDLGSQEHRYAQQMSQIDMFTDLDICNALQRGQPFANIARDIISRLPDKVWISLDVDGLDPSLCPNTGTPVPGGLSWHQALTLLSTLGKSGKTLLGFDLVEVGNAHWDANVGARLLYKLAGWSINSQVSQN